MPDCHFPSPVNMHSCCCCCSGWLAGWRGVYSHYNGWYTGVLFYTPLGSLVPTKHAWKMKEQLYSCTLQLCTHTHTHTPCTTTPMHLYTQHTTLCITCKEWTQPKDYTYMNIYVDKTGRVKQRKHTMLCLFYGHDVDCSMRDLEACSFWFTGMVLTNRGSSCFPPDSSW